MNRILAISSVVVLTSSLFGQGRPVTPADQAAGEAWWANVKALADAGFLGMTIPKQYGGPGLGFLDASLVVAMVMILSGIAIGTIPMPKRTAVEADEALSITVVRT